MSHEFKVGDDVALKGDDTLWTILYIDDETKTAFVRSGGLNEMFSLSDFIPREEQYIDQLTELFSGMTPEEIAELVAEKFTRNGQVHEVKPLSYDGYVAIIEYGATNSDDYAALVDGGYIRSPE